MSSPQHQPKVLISGASIAGPALARWLGRNGFAVTVVEKAPQLRPGGQAVDFKGPTHLRLLKELGVYEDICAAQTARTDWRIVNAKDQVQAVVPGEFLGGTVEILRGDLTTVLHRHSEANATYLFGDEITALKDDGTGVDVEFAHRAPERFDIVVGADGVHSAVRRLAFGPEHEHLVATGYYYAVASTTAPLDDLETTLPDGRAVAYFYSEPGRSAILGGQKAPSLFIFDGSKDKAGYDRHSLTSQVAFMRRHYDGAGWRVPAALEGVDAPDANFYLDQLVRTSMTSFTRGRVVLVGDAGYANTLGGFGTGLALMGAYVLAGELVKHLEDGNYAAALAEYDRAMAKPSEVARTETGAPSFLAPASNWRIWVRNCMFSSSWMTSFMIWIANRMATDESLPKYDLK